MNQLEFKKHLFLSKKDELIKSSMTGSFFSVCEIDKLLNMSANREDRAEIMASEAYCKIESCHVIHFKGMTMELKQELERCVGEVCRQIETTFEPRIKKTGCLEMLFNRLIK